MSEQTIAVDAKGIYYAPEGTALPTINTSLTDAVWTAAGWSKVEEVTDDGVELALKSDAIVKRPMGTRMPTGKRVVTEGMEKVVFASYRNDEATVNLALATPTTVSGGITTGGSVSYVAMAVQSENCVYHMKKVSAKGTWGTTYKPEDWSTTPFEFECYEDDSEAAGTTNWARYKIS